MNNWLLTLSTIIQVKYKTPTVLYNIQNSLNISVDTGMFGIEEKRINQTITLRQNKKNRMYLPSHSPLAEQYGFSLH